MAEMRPSKSQGQMEVSPEPLGVDLEETEQTNDGLGGDGTHHLLAVRPTSDDGPTFECIKMEKKCELLLYI